MGIFSGQPYPIQKGMAQEQNFSFFPLYASSEDSIWPTMGMQMFLGDNHTPT